LGGRGSVRAAPRMARREARPPRIVQGRLGRSFRIETRVAGFREPKWRRFFAEEPEMRIEELRRAKDQRPVRPFMIRMADGREIQVRPPDAIAWGPEHPRTATCVLPNGGWEYINFALITSLGVSALPANP